MLVRNKKLFKLLLVFFTPLASGCTATNTYYVHASASHDTTTYCTNREESNNSIALGEGVRISVSLGPGESKQSLSATLQIPLRQGQAVQFENQIVEIEIEGIPRRLTAKLGNFSIGIFGKKGTPGYFEYISATQPLKGSGRNITAGSEPYLQYDLYLTRMEFNTSPPEALTMILPPLQVNGKHMVVPPQRFVSVTRSVCVPLM